MRVPLIILLLLPILMSCRKEVPLPQLSFSKEEKQWFIYQKGQQLKFKNNLGDSLVYNVSEVQFNQDVPEYKDTSKTEIISYSQSYYAVLKSSDDSIFIYFYKETLFGSNPDKMKQTIRWLRVKNQFAYLSAVENRTPFGSRTITGTTYLKVTEVLSLGDTIYPFTRYDKAYYDQQAGFVEIIDINGNSWKRE